MATQTTTYSFDLPTLGGDSDLWGGFLNGNWDVIDGQLALSVRRDMQKQTAGQPVGTTEQDTFTDVVHITRASSNMLKLFNTASSAVGDPQITAGNNGAVGFTHGDDEEVTAALVSASGTTVNNDMSIITREKGDFRYLRSDTTGTLDGDFTVTGSLTVNTGGTISGGLSLDGGGLTEVLRVRAGDGTSGAPTFAFTSETNKGFYLNGGRPAFSHGGVFAAAIDANGTATVDGNTIMTRQKSDARYAQIDRTSTNSVGDHCYLYWFGNGQTVGDTMAGSSLFPAGVVGDSSTIAVDARAGGTVTGLTRSSNSRGGTWVLCGANNSDSGTNYARSSLWRRYE